MTVANPSPAVDRELRLDEIRWHLEAFPPMEADEVLDLDDAAALVEVGNVLAGPLVASLKTTRRLTVRLRAVSAVLRGALTVMAQQHAEITTLHQQNRALRDELRKAKAK